MPTLGPEVFNAIMDEIAAGEPAKKALKARNINPRVFWAFLGQNSAAAEKYAQARARGLDRWAEEMVEISADSSLTPEDRRIRIDTLKWLLSKLAPKKYGDLLHLQHSVQVDFATELEAARKRLNDAPDVKVISGADSGVKRAVRA